MNKRFIAVLAFAFVVASGASLLLYRLMASRPAAATAAPATVKVALAARNLDAGTFLKESDVKLGDWSGAVPAGASAKLADVVGRTVTATIYSGEPVVNSRLAEPGSGGGLAAMIPKGMRAVAVRVNEVAGVAGFVVTGMHVDVLISGSAPGAGRADLGNMTKTMLQNILVLSAGQDFKKDNEGKPVVVQVVNLLVTPEQAEQLSLATNQTTIQLVLRNPLDMEVAKTPGAAMRNLFTGQKLDIPRETEPRPEPRPRAPRPMGTATAAVRTAAAAPAPFVMEIIQGNSRKETKFTSGSEARP
jgi:pilus assembly protein CpaB